MATKRVSKEELDKFAKDADSHTRVGGGGINNYEAVVNYGPKNYHIWTEALNPVSDGYIKPITREQANKLMLS